MAGLLLALEPVEEGAAALAGNPWALAAGLALIAAAVLLLRLAKQIAVNSLLGVVAWAVATYGLKLELPFWASLAVSALFGLAGLGAMLVLRFMGVL